MRNAEKVAQAVALIGTVRTVCPMCGAQSIVGLGLHNPNSAAMECGVPPQDVYRAYKRKLAAEAKGKP